MISWVAQRPGVKPIGSRIGAGVAGVGQPGGSLERTRVPQPAGEQGQRLAHVGAGHEVAQAVVRPAAEPEVRLAALGGDVEAGRRRPAGRCRPTRCRGGPWCRPASSTPSYSKSSSTSRVTQRDGRVDPHDLLDGGLAQLGTLGEQRPLVGVADEGLHGQAELVAGGVVAAEDQQHQPVAQLLVAQRAVAVAGGVDQRGDEVVPRAAPAGRRSARRRSRRAGPARPRSGAAPRLRVTPIARPTVAASLAMIGHSSSGMPSMMAMHARGVRARRTRETNSQWSSCRKPSMSSSASAWNRGTRPPISLGEKAGFISRRSRWCSSPSLFRIQLANQSANGPSVIPLCAGQATLPCRRLGVLEQPAHLRRSGARRSRTAWWRTSSPRGPRAPPSEVMEKPGVGHVERGDLGVGRAGRRVIRASRLRGRRVETVILHS